MTMLSPVDDTITAQASARGAGYRGIVRLSGPDSVAVLRPWFRVSADDDSQHAGHRFFEAGPKPQVVEGELLIWGNNLPVPCTAYYWPEGRGFTGQQSVELHTLGSQPLLDAVVRTLCESGCRLAGPGEFTLRAFLSGRIDLPQAEAVLGVIEADDHRQLDVALRQLAGGIGRPLAALRERLLEMVCHIEAEFDFADEEIEFLDRDVLRQELETSLQLIRNMQQQMQQRASSAERAKVVLTGRPNAGKSSLFNAIIEHAAMFDADTQNLTAASASRVSAIVSPQPGTTRDWIEAELSANGVPLTLIDTAGVEMVEVQSDVDRPRQLAQTFARDALEQAAIVLLCLESGTRPNESEISLLKENAEHTMIVRTKTDLHNDGNDCLECGDVLEIATSAETGEGLPQLFEAIQERLQRENRGGDVVPATAVRCRESLHHAVESLQNAMLLTETLRDDLLIATEIRVALEHIGQMTGAVHNDEILDRIFSRFCIGK